MIFRAHREAGRQFFLQLYAAIIAELDAISLCEQTAAMATDENIRAVLLDVAREGEKARAGEFQGPPSQFDKEQAEELAHGEEECGRNYGGITFPFPQRLKTILPDQPVTFFKEG
ncbi:MAG: hypothetical protein AB1330_03470 [Bacillota bacterium]